MVLLFPDCGDPAPENGYSNSTTGTIGEMVVVQCDLGYDVIGQNIISCASDGMWTSNTSCALKGNTTESI